MTAPKRIDFELLRARFWFRAVDRVTFPPGKAGNVLRGAFGATFRRIVCLPECPGAAACQIRTTCPYAQVFEPNAASGEGPSGLRNWPRPFVFRASWLGGTIEPGAMFHFDLHLFELRQPVLPYFILTFAQVAREGWGPGRGSAELQRVEVVGAGEEPPTVAVGVETLFVLDALPLVSLSFDPWPQTVDRLVVRFVTPTELKAGHEVVSRPEFAVLLRRTRDRLSTLRSLYGQGPLNVDFRALGERAGRIELARWEWQSVEAERVSGRTGQRHSIGGFVGEAEYAGDLTEFVPYLQAAKWVGVGRHTVWGNGELGLVF